MSTWELAGYEVQELLGTGATGEVWCAVELATGERVALKRLRDGAGAVGLEGLRREAERLGGLDTPYVVRLRRVVDDVLVLDLADGGSLAELLARRGRLDPGEVVTVCAPLASALGVAHAHGVVHGDVSPANVLFTADGMPQLSDFGASPSQGTAEYADPVAGAEPGPASDVWALGALCHHLLTGTPPYTAASLQDVLTASAVGRRAPLGLLAPQAPRALVAVVESALSADPAARPSAAALGVALQRAQAAAPVRLQGGPPPAGPVADVRETHEVPRPAPSRAESPPDRRRVPVVAVAGVLVVLALLAGGLTWALGSHGSPVPQALPPVAASGWASVLGGLDLAREQAYATADPALLDGVYAPGSSARAVDVAAVSALASAGQVASEVRHEVRRVDEVSATADRVELRVVDVFSSQVVSDVQGRSSTTLAGRGEQAHDVVLVRAGTGWRIAELRPD